MADLNPFEFTIVSFLQMHRGRKFTHSEIARHCGMNVKTAKKYCMSLSRRNIIKKEKVRNQRVPRYFVE